MVIVFTQLQWWYVRICTFRDILPLLKSGLFGENPYRAKLACQTAIDSWKEVQGDTNYRLLNIQTVSQAAEYPSQDAKQKQLAARQPKECQTNGRYLTQSTAIQGQSVRRLDESLPCKAASITRLPKRLLNNVVSIKTYFLHMSSTEHIFPF